MPAKFFSLSNKADRQILKLPLKIQIKIRLAFRTIKENPLSGPKLSGELFDYQKFRIGDYRIIYKFDPKKSLVEVVKVEHRGGVYR